MNKLKLIYVSILFSVAAMSAQAHHSFNALFDVSQTIYVSGEIAAFKFIAPHSYIQLIETVDGNAQVMWEVETTTPGMLSRKGVTPQTLQPGQIISVTGNPTRDGRKLIRLLTLTMPDGQELEIQ